MQMENSVGWPPTRSSATGPTHLERGQLMWKIHKKYWQLISLAGSSLNSETVPVHQHKTKTKKHENIVVKPLTQLVCNRADSSGKVPAHLKYIYKKKRDKQLILYAGSSPNSSGTGPAHHLGNSKNEDWWDSFILSCFFVIVESFKNFFCVFYIRSKIKLKGIGR